MIQEDTNATSERAAGVTPNDIENSVMQLAVENRRTTADGIVKNHIIASIALGLVPVPLFDLAALTTTQMNMLRGLSECYGLEAADTDLTSLVTSLVAGSLPVLGVVGLSSFVKLIPGVGSLVGSASLGVSAGAVTYAVGQTFIMHFEEGGTLEDFEPKQAREFFKREFEAGKSFVKDIRHELKEAKADDTEASVDESASGAEKKAADERPTVS